jgi:hypothetical protein
VEPKKLCIESNIFKIDFAFLTHSMVSTRRSKDSKAESSILDTFVSDVIEKPQIFFAKDEQSAAKAIAVAKNLYDTGKHTATVSFCCKYNMLLTS